jgi:hypothetical protein
LRKDEWCFFYGKEVKKKILQRKMGYFDKRRTIGFFCDGKEEAKKFEVCFRLVIVYL